MRIRSPVFVARRISLTPRDQRPPEQGQVPQDGEHGRAGAHQPKVRFESRNWAKCLQRNDWSEGIDFAHARRSKSPCWLRFRGRANGTEQKRKTSLWNPRRKRQVDRAVRLFRLRKGRVGLRERSRLFRSSRPASPFYSTRRSFHWRRVPRAARRRIFARITARVVQVRHRPAKLFGQRLVNDCHTRTRLCCFRSVNARPRSTGNPTVEK